MKNSTDTSKNLTEFLEVSCYQLYSMQFLQEENL